MKPPSGHILCRGQSRISANQPLRRLGNRLQVALKPVITRWRRPITGARISAIQDALTAPEHLVPSAGIRQPKTLYNAPQSLWDAEQVLSGVGLGRGDDWSTRQTGTRPTSFSAWLRLRSTSRITRPPATGAGKRPHRLERPQGSRSISKRHVRRRHPAVRGGCALAASCPY
jgi:hypothetical protein